MFSPRRSWIRLAIILLFASFVFSSSASACNVPVFRYALERWPSDPYDILLFHKGPLSPADKKIVALMEKHISGDGAPVNLRVELVDVDEEMPKGLKRIYEAQKTPELPWMVVRYPLQAKNDATIWAGRLSEPIVKSLLDSPVRRDLVKRIAGGETAVWVLLESGDKQKDDAAAAVLEKRLPKLKTILKLPELTDSPADRIANDGPPLKIAFSLIRLSRTNPDEQMLIGMLLNSEDDLLDNKEPMAFPIFGRGRALWALIGKGIIDDNIDEAGAFLVGPCSCQVKRLNPGTDLLMMGDWDSLIEGKRIKSVEAPSLHGIPDHLLAGNPIYEKLSLQPRELDPESGQPVVMETLTQPPRQEEWTGANHPYLTASNGQGEEIIPPPTSNSRFVLLRNIGLAVLASVVILGAYALVLRGKTNR